MNGFLPEPTRWKDRTDQANLAERAAGRTVRAMDPPEPLSGPQLARIAARIRSERSRKRPRRLWLTATAILLVGGAAVASADHLRLLPRWFTGIVRPTPASAPATRPSRHLPRTNAPAPLPAAMPAEAPTPSPEAPILAPPTHTMETAAPTTMEKGPDSAQQRLTARQTAQRPLALHAPPTQATIPVEPPPPAPSAPPPTTRAPADPAIPSAPVGVAASPANHLTQAIQALRVRQSPQAALALLDRYSPTLDRSDFRHEALLLRVEALLKLQRSADALRLLEATTLTDVPASRTLLLTRGELRAEAGRCVEALADFDRVLTQARGKDRRALFGIVKCHKHLGNDARARAEMDRYRREFPSQHDTPSP